MLLKTREKSIIEANYPFKTTFNENEEKVYKLLTSPVDHLMPWGVLSSY